MHELSLAMGLLELLEEQAREHGLKRLQVVRLQVGSLAGVDEAALRFAFEVAAVGGVAEGATLELEAVPGRGACTDCGTGFALPGLAEPCPACGSYRVDVLGGRELRVRELEGE